MVENAHVPPFLNSARIRTVVGKVLTLWPILYYNYLKKKFYCAYISFFNHFLHIFINVKHMLSRFRNTINCDPNLDKLLKSCNFRKRGCQYILFLLMAN